jgi:hypothetical protein
MNMEKTKNTSVYLEDVHIKYLSLMSAFTGLNKSQLIRDMVDNDMRENQEFVKTFEKILY